MSCCAILVNFHTAELIEGAVASLTTSPRCSEVIVVDNSDSPEEWERLNARIGGLAKIIRNTRNQGFAKACNLAFQSSNSDYVLLLNPDARLVGDALDSMCMVLDTDPRVAAVGPKVFWDDAYLYLLPPTTFPSKLAVIAERLAQHSQRFALKRSLQFRDRAIAQWTSKEPLQIDAASGGHVLLRRDALNVAGGLFDPDFFMYWEDSDLMQRIRSAGYRVVLHPAAHATHLYEHDQGKDVLIAKGWNAYASKYFSSLFFRGLLRFISIWPRSSTQAFDSTLEKPKDAIRLEISSDLHHAWLLEISPSPDFYPSIGRFGNGQIVEISADLLRRFSGDRLYLRLGPPYSVSDQKHLKSYCLIT